MQKEPKKEQEDKTSFKEKVLYSILAVGGMLGLGFLGKRELDKILAGRSHAESFKDGTPATTAKQIKMAFDNDDNFGTNVKSLRIVLKNIQSQGELNKVYHEYKRQYGSNMYEDMSKELQASEYNEMLQIMKGKPEKQGQAPTSVQHKAWAKRLQAAFDKTYSFIPGTDETAIKAVFYEIPTQKDFALVASEFLKEYHTPLVTALASELESWEMPEYSKIITSKPPS